MRALDVMNSSVLAVSPELPLAQFEELLSGEDISGAPVTDEHGRVLGIVSKTDIVRALSEQQSEALLRLFAEGISVGEIMTKDVVIVSPEAEVHDVARVMAENGLHRVLVGSKEKVLGIISALDLVGWIAAKPAG